MARQLIITPRAKSDLDEIWEYIARDSFDAAYRVEEELHREIRNLVQFPGKGHSREEVDDHTLRFWKVYSYLIVYRYDDVSLNACASFTALETSANRWAVIKRPTLPNGDPHAR